MRKQLILLIALFGFVACNSCVPQPSPVPPVPPAPTTIDAGPPAPPPVVVVVDAGPNDAGGASFGGAAPQPDTTPGVRLACDNLAALKCAEGMTGCYRVLQHVVDVQLTAVPLGCLVGAHSKADVHACGPFVACP